MLSSESEEIKLHGNLEGNWSYFGPGIAYVPSRRSIIIFKVFLLFFMIVLFIESVFFIMAGLNSNRISSTLLGFFSIITTVLAFYGVFRRNLLILLWCVIYLEYLFIVHILFVILFMVDHNNKCINKMPLEQRINHLSIGISCTDNISLDLIPFILSIIVNLFLVCSVFLVYNGVCYETGIKVIDKRIIATEVIKQRQKYWYITLIISLLVCGSISGVIGAKEFNNVGAVFSGTCPTGPYFFNQPRIADLDCCQFHSNASCIKPGTDICNTKPNLGVPNSASNTTDGGTTCDNLLGLLSCSFFGLNASNFYTNNGTWTTITICQSFCDSLYSSCGGIQNYNTSYAFCGQQYSNILDINVVNNNYTTCFNVATHLFNPNLALIALTIFIAVKNL